ncbi:MAG: hypothetical protein RLZZ628_3133 [Bacteroidota bacterium]|jgi:DNA (cytosine-5)-methyltransferase 1
MELVLSLYSGIGMFDAVFKNAGFCVVSAGDIKDGQHHNITKFQGIKGKFEGILITSPCQEFSKANRLPNYDLGCAYITEAIRIIFECAPDWCIFENVEGFPDVHIFGYAAQRFFLNDSHVGGIQDRNRKFQFLYKSGNCLRLQRQIPKNGIGIVSCVTTRASISVPEMSRIQGFSNLQLIGYCIEGAKRAIGNGVSFATGRAIAWAIRNRNRETPGINHRLCACGCGEAIESPIQVSKFATCRKRIERMRKNPNKALFYCPQCEDGLVNSGMFGMVNCQCVSYRILVRNLYTPNLLKLE